MTSVVWKMGLVRRSWSSVVSCPLRPPVPQNEPPPWVGKTLISSGSPRSLTCSVLRASRARWTARCGPNRSVRAIAPRITAPPENSARGRPLAWRTPRSWSATRKLELPSSEAGTASTVYTSLAERDGRGREEDVDRDQRDRHRAAVEKRLRGHALGGVESEVDEEVAQAVREMEERKGDLDEQV